MVFLSLWHSNIYSKSRLLTYELLTHLLTSVIDITIVTKKSCVWFTSMECIYTSNRYDLYQACNRSLKTFFLGLPNFGTLSAWQSTRLHVLCVPRTVNKIRFKKMMGYRSTVGRLTLDQLIGVRIPVPQPHETSWEDIWSTLLEDRRVLFFVYFCPRKTTDAAFSAESTSVFFCDRCSWLFILY